MEDDEERAIELSSIAAIFPELVIDENDPYHATLDILVTPEKPLKIYFQSTTQAAPQGLLTPPSTATAGSEDVTKEAPIGLSSAVLNVDVHQLAHLPPLKLDIKLPDGYPLEKAPEVRVHADQLWLPEKTLNGIKNKCAEFWEEAGHDQVVYTFIDYIQQEAEKAFGLADNKDDKFELPSKLKLILLDYDHKRRQEQFENETFDCGICLEPKKGKKCHQMLLCGHVFCISCLQDFYNNAISEGDVDSVKCLDPGCGKTMMAQMSPARRRKVDLTLNPSELLQIPIEQEQVQRYVRLKRKKRLEADKNTIYCPRQWCQGAAKSKRHPKSDDPLRDSEVYDGDSDPEPEPEAQVNNGKKKKSKEPEIPMSERLSVCEDCNFAFCSVCKKGWHGELANCNPRRKEELNEEEQASIAYMKKYSTPCPTCEAPAQKTHGCNHMICFKCKTHFCYLCSSFLMPENPYRHFNDLKSTCYMRLWELEGGDGADVGIGYAGGNNMDHWEEEETDEEEEDELPAVANARNVPPPANWDDDTDDEEPAPDQRRADRPAHIEIVNFAGNGANRRIEVQPAAPPAVPEAPPAVQQNRRVQNRQVPRRQAARPANIPEVRVMAAPGQGNNPGPGLQRFLRLAMADREDEWDSDDDD